MMKPLISVCIPTYNGTKYLRECIDSVLAQTFTDFEVLVVDDQSSDETLSIVWEYATHDHRIRVIQNEQNLGLVGNWNRCIELAQGEWIKFVFQDDLVAPTCLEQMLLASKPESSILCCRRNFIFETGVKESVRQYYLTIRTVESFFPGLTNISAADYCGVVLEDEVLNFVGEPTAVMLHRSVFYRFGVFNPHLIQFCDLEFWTRVAIHTGIIYVPETLATFRVHAGATTAVNKTSRYYRARILDPIPMLNDFAFHSNYAPLRTTAASRHPPINLVKLLANRAHKARMIAAYEATKPVNPDPSFLEDWKQMTTYYPNLSNFSIRITDPLQLPLIGPWRKFKRWGQPLLERSGRKKTRSS
jgi:glycosyltransferase involved in cell wall biosynthesis